MKSAFIYLLANKSTFFFSCLPLFGVYMGFQKVFERLFMLLGVCLVLVLNKLKGTNFGVATSLKSATLSATGETDRLV
jgi:hypothetical protein